MKEKTKKFIMTIVLFILVQQIPATLILMAPYLHTGVYPQPTALQSGLVAIVTSLIYIPLLRIEKLRNKIYPKVIKFIMIWNFVGGFIVIILGFILNK